MKLKSMLCPNYAANGKSTVPQIFIKDHHVGGCDDLFALEAKNQLDSLLAD